MVSSKQEVNTLLNKCYENSVLRLQGAPSPGWGASLQRSHVKNEQHSDRQVVKQCPRKAKVRGSIVHSVEQRNSSAREFLSWILESTVP